MATMTKAQRADQADAVAYLQERIKVGDTVYGILRNVARSGMQRKLDLYIMRDNEPFRITRSAATATGMRYDERSETLIVQGCGTDVCFEAVYNLSMALFPDGFDCTGNRHSPACPSNDHSNDHYHYQEMWPGLSWDETEPLRYSVDRHHGNNGYALKYRWMN